jgi:hypothetical protein
MSVSYARPESETGETNSDSIAIISLKSGDNVVSEASVPASAPVHEGRVYIVVDGRVNTGLAIANDTNQAAEISFYFTDATGNDVTRGSFTLEGKRNIAAFANQAPFNVPGSMEGSMTFSSSVPVAVTAIRGLVNERGDFLMTTLPVGSVGSTSDKTSVVFPHFADGAGWSTQVILTNPTDSPLAGTLQFFGQDGAAALSMTVNGVTDSTFNYNVAPRSAVRMVTTSASADVKVGYVVATAAGGSVVPEGLSVFSFTNQGVTVSEAGVPAASMGKTFRTYVESWGALRSGLAVANASAAPAHVAFELSDLDGSATGLTASVEIPAGGHVAGFVDEMFPTLPAGFQGMLRIVSTQPVATIGLRVRINERGESLITAIPVADEAAPVVKSSEVVFPLVVNGGGYSTDFIRIKK